MDNQNDELKRIIELSKEAYEKGAFQEVYEALKEAYELTLSPTVRKLLSQWFYLPGKREDWETLQRNIQELYLNEIYDFTDGERCKRKKREDSRDRSDSPLFSFMMATYNDMSFFNRAVSSLLEQDYTDWELVIWDNSDKNRVAWKMIQNATELEPRIRSYKSDRNIGWAKGASELLKHVRGRYVTFLAEDDCIKKGSLECLAKVIKLEEPDVIWVGNVCVEYADGNIKILGGTIPEYQCYGEENRSDAIVEIMQSCYYNSFFHYMKLDFLKQNRIDFYQPYYGDCAGMTKCLEASRKMVMIDRLVYCLTLNTSQTRGWYLWDSYDLVYANQWRSIRQVFFREKYSNLENIKYVAARILNNFLGGIPLLCKGRCRNLWMSPVEKNGREILGQLEEILACDAIGEMMCLYEEAFSAFLLALKSLNKLGSDIDENMIIDSWISPLLWIGMKGDMLEEKDQIKWMAQWLLADKNKWCIGFSYFISLLNGLSDRELMVYQNDMHRIVSRYESIGEF